MKFTADFETATWLSDETYVWAWATCEINNPENIEIGNNIDTFFDYIKKFHNPIFYFHNLKFDGEFIIHYLLTHGYEHIKNSKDRKDNSFTTLISDMGMFYEITVFLKVGNKKTSKITFIDSLKIIPFSVADIAKSFGLPISKLEIDYDEPRELGHELTDEEKDYIKNDVKIVALALQTLFLENLTSITSASNALKDFKTTHSKSRYERLFPQMPYEVDKDMRQAYKGGFTYLNEIYEEVDVGSGVVLDINSLYPSVMHEKPMAIGYPEFYEGEYTEDLVYPLYIQMITCSFELKKNKIPTIQIKKSHFIDNEYLTSSNNEIVCLTLSNIDLKLFLEQYNVYDLEYVCGWKFKSMKGVFTDYIDKWIGVKIEATKEGNKGKRTLAKIMLNSLYGKFSTSQDMQEKYPYIEDDVVKYYLGDKDTKKGLYLPIGIFITSYAREKTIRTSQAIKDYSIEKYGKDLYIYSDTDSIHTLLPIEELKQFCEIDDYALGKWKHEGSFRKARFIRQKCYIEELRENIDLKSFNKIEDFNYNLNKIKLIKENKFNKIYKYDIKITCAGMPKSCYEFVEWEKFKKGFTCGGKLTFKHVKGGVKLVETDFTIKGDTRLKNNIINF